MNTLLARYNRFGNRLAILFAAIMLCGAALLPLSQSGCRTPADQTALAATATVVTTVDAAMKVWKQAVLSGQVTQAQADAVKSAYQKYYAAAVVERDGWNAYVASGRNTNSIPSQALAAALASKADLLALVTQFLPADKLAMLKGITQ